MQPAHANPTIAIAYDPAEETTSLSLGETEVCIGDDNTVSIVISGQLLRFRTPAQLRALRALLMLLDQPTVRTFLPPLPELNP